MRVESTRMVASALLNKGDSPLAGTVRRVFTVCAQSHVAAKPHQSPGPARPSQPILRTPCSRLPPSTISRRTLVRSVDRAGTVHNDPIEPQLLTPSARWQGAPQTRHHAFGTPASSTPCAKASGTDSCFAQGKASGMALPAATRHSWVCSSGLEYLREGCELLQNGLWGHNTQRTRMEGVMEAPDTKRDFQ